MKLAEALGETGVAEILWDVYTVSVREDEDDDGRDIYVVSYCVKAMPPHAQTECKTLAAIWEDLADSFLPAEIAKGDGWESVETEDSQPDEKEDSE